MPRTLGNDKSTLKRGQRNTRKAEYGVCGDYLCVTPKWKWNDEGDFVRTFVLDDGEKLHILFVYTWEIEAVFRALGGTWSYSKHLGTRLLYDAAFLSPKLRIWNHGLVRPHVVAGQIAGFTEEHAERLPKVKAPWIQETGGNSNQPGDPVSAKRPAAAKIIRL